MGTRLREASEKLPKPLVDVGGKPILWHIMKTYSHFGFRRFVLCLGYGAHHVKDYFLRYAETESNDFVLRGGQVELLGSDVQDWTITFVHTGLDSPIGERLRRVRRHVEQEEMFLANYADVLTDAFRAALLRLNGYRVDVVEFVDSAHTPRNLLLRARRTGRADPGAGAEYEALTAQWGVTPALERLLSRR